MAYDPYAHYDKDTKDALIQKGNSRQKEEERERKEKIARDLADKQRELEHLKFSYEENEFKKKANERELVKLQLDDQRLADEVKRLQSEIAGKKAEEEQRKKDRVQLSARLLEESKATDKQMLVTAQKLKAEKHEYDGTVAKQKQIDKDLEAEKQKQLQLKRQLAELERQLKSTEEHLGELNKARVDLLHLVDKEKQDLIDLELQAGKERKRIYEIKEKIQTSGRSTFYDHAETEKLNHAEYELHVRQQQLQTKNRVIQDKSNIIKSADSNMKQLDMKKKRLEQEIRMMRQQVL